MDVSSNDINSCICELLSETLQKSNLLKLNISKNKIGDKGIEILSQALPFNRSKLTHLNLSDCGIEYPGLIKLFDSLKQNFSLNTLIVDNNYGSADHTFLSISNLLRNNNFIEYLSL